MTRLIVSVIEKAQEDSSMTEPKEIYVQESDKVVSQETKDPSLLRTKTAVTIALVGGMALGAMFFSMPNASASKKSEAASAIEVATPPEDESSPEPMMVQSDEQVTSYSTDGGVTQTQGIPPGTTVTESPDGGQGMVTSSQGTSPPSGSPEGGTIVKTSPDGTSEYSTDGGVTWTEGLPPGAETVTNPDGSQGVMVTEPGVPAQ